MKLKLAVAAMLFAAMSLAAQPTGETWSNVGSGFPCSIANQKNADGSETWFCATLVKDSTGDTSYLTIYVVVQPDGTFHDGRINKNLEYDVPPYDDTPSFSTTGWIGTFDGHTFTGNFSDGSVSGFATETLGSVRVRYATRTGLVSGSGTLTQ